MKSGTRQSRGEATRARLLDGGRSVFARRGYRSTRVGDIVAAAGTSQGTFYLYFDSKDDLFSQLQAEVALEFDRLAADLPALGPDPESVEDLAAWIERFLAACHRHRPILRASTEADAAVGRDTVAAHLEPLAEALAERSGLPERRSFDPGVASLALIATLERLDHMAGDGRLDVTDQDLARTTADMVSDGLFGPRPDLTTTDRGNKISKRERAEST